MDIEGCFPTTGSDGTIYDDFMADPTNLPDIMNVYWMNNANQYIEDGIIWDPTDYIQNMLRIITPGFRQIRLLVRRLAMKTDATAGIMRSDFSQEDGGWNDSYQGLCEDWLKECGLEIPETVSEFENVIRVFHEKYGNL